MLETQPNFVHAENLNNKLTTRSNSDSSFIMFSVPCFNKKEKVVTVLSMPSHAPCFLVLDSGCHVQNDFYSFEQNCDDRQGFVHEVIGTWKSGHGPTGTNENNPVPS